MLNQVNKSSKSKSKSVKGEVVMTKEQLLKTLGTDVMELTFTKKNGELRTMVCTRCPEHIPSEATPKGTLEIAESSDNVRVFDLEKKAWRSFNYSSIVG